MSPSSLRRAPSTLMIAGHFSSREGIAAGIFWSERMTNFLPFVHCGLLRFLGRSLCPTSQLLHTQSSRLKLVELTISSTESSCTFTLLVLERLSSTKLPHEKESTLGPSPEVACSPLIARCILMKS